MVRNHVPTASLAAPILASRGRKKYPIQLLHLDQRPRRNPAASSQRPATPLCSIDPQWGSGGHIPVFTLCPKAIRMTRAPYTTLRLRSSWCQAFPEARAENGLIVEKKWIEDKKSRGKRKKKRGFRVGKDPWHKDG